MKDNATSLAMRETATAVHALRHELRPVPEIRGYVSDLTHLPGLQTALRLCRDIGTGEGLVQLFRRVPAQYVAKGVVTCLCGSSLPVGDLMECPGGCGRFFAGDESGVWAARVPTGESDAA